MTLNLTGVENAPKWRTLKEAAIDLNNQLLDSNVALIRAELDRDIARINLDVTQQLFSQWRAAQGDDSRILQKTREIAALGWILALCLGLGWWLS
jgi:hypothetical protein